MTFSINKEPEQLTLVYRPRFGADWIEARLQDGEISIRHLFHFSFDDCLALDSESAVFRLGFLENDFYRVDRKKLGMRHDLFVHADFPITQKIFSTAKSIAIFPALDKVYGQSIILGGNEERSISREDFERLLDLFPTDYELKMYIRARISAAANDFFDIPSDAQRKYANYINKKLAVIENKNIVPVEAYELEKYIYLRDRLREMLANSDGFSEAAWQKEIIKFILLLFPNYITTLEKVSFSEEYSQKSPTRRELDIALLDIKGNIDIIEIKKPFPSCIVRSSTYRDNFIPARELSGTVVQAQKYLFYLSKLGKKGEDTLTQRYASVLPSGMEIRITNPRAMLIMGRDHNLSNNQLFDFELFKRKYADIIDIITYDDLLRRLEHIINHLRADHA